MFKFAVGRRLAEYRTPLSNSIQAVNFLIDRGIKVFKIIFVEKDQRKLLRVFICRIHRILADFIDGDFVIFIIRD